VGCRLREKEKVPLSGMIGLKIFGWAIYAAGFAIWLFGYLSVAPLFSRL